MRNTLHHIILSIKCSSSKNARFTNFLQQESKLLQGVVLFLLFSLISVTVLGQAAASSNYSTQTGTLGTTYSWIDCSSGSSIVSGDDTQASISWPFTFSFYDNTYTTANSLSVCSNGFIRLDGTASTSYTAASAYSLSSSSTELGQIIAMDVYDCNVSSSSWVRSLVTGSSPNRIFTIEYQNHEIDYNDGLYADVQVSFYETSNLVVLKLGTDDITKAGVDMGIHSGVSGYSTKWQEVLSGTNNSWIELTPGGGVPPSGPAASWNYDTQTGVTGTTYSWIDCSSGTTIVSGDDAQAEISWPFDFHYYDNDYTTSNSLSVATNGFIRLDGVASTDYAAASAYDLTSTATGFGQIIAMAVYDGNVSATSWVRSLVTGTAPNQVFTIEYNNYEIDYDDALYANAQVSFYESSNKIVLKLGTDNINKSGVDMGLHSGVNTYFNKWQEVLSGTNNTWIEYTPPYIEVNATGGSTLAYYSMLKSAFDKINDGTHQGEIVIKIKHSTTEPATAVLSGSGSKGVNNYSSVHIYPTETGLSISGDLAAPLIDIDGADNVTIDGRVNATGSTKDLSIINTSTGSATGTSAIRFINDASDNTVKYCTIKSSETRASSGIIFFSTTTETSGNDNNTIEYNDITNAADANRPVNAIYSQGTAGKDNSGNNISNNNIYDFLKQASASRGILLESSTTAWTIDGNSFYETASYTGTGTVTYNAIKINNVSGNGFTVSNNYIGGSAAQCGGTAWTKTNATNNVFNAIYLKVGNTVASSIQNNTIKNFSWSNSGIADWIGIDVLEGKVDIGTVTGNTIGAITGTNSISVTGGTNGQNIYGIRLESADEINCNNNNIGSLTGTTTSTYSTHIYGIRLYGSATVSISNNTIGSTTTASSIYASSASTANQQKVYGIYSSSSGVTHIHENTISNLKNNTSNTAVGTRGLINGIYLTAGTNEVCENTIRDISIANASTSTWTPSAIGIHLNTTTEAQSIHENLIYNISNTYSSFTGCVVGIFTRNSVGASAGDISANFIHSLSVTSAGANIYGIYENTDAIVYANNIITLGGSTSTELFGIYDVGNSGKSVYFFFNTIYISGSESGSEKSYALRYNTNSNTRDLRNNILFNARSGGTGGHYAIYYDATGGTFTADYNDYYVTGTGGVIGYYGGDQSTLALLQTATSQDANSLKTNPGFTSAGGLNSSDYVTSASLTGVTGTGITTDYDGVTRGNPPKIGALEVSVIFIWQGNTSTDFATATNWQNGTVPPDGANIEFAATPANDCYLDQARTLYDITNTSTKKLYVNAKQLTLTGDIVSATANQIDATAASSVVIFAGTAVQSIPSGIFVSNTIDGLTLNNDHGLTQNGDLILSTTFTLTDGEYSIGANTLTINGAVSTTSGTLTGGSTSNIIVGGSGASTTLPNVSVNNLTLNRANGISLGGDVSVAGTLALTAGTLTLGANTFTISGNSPTRVSGNIDASNASATLEFTNTSAVTLVASLFTGNINNLTIDGAGITAADNFTINGILDLQSANPSATKGSLDMSTDTLSMGSTSTTTGTGDVTGIVKREHTFITSTEYSFGSQYTTFTFIDANTKPIWICVKISIGTVPTWSPWTPVPNGKVKRLYQVAASDNSSTSQANINMRYLISELDATYNDETKLIFWHKFTNYLSGVPHEHGKSNQDFTNHFIGVTGLTFGAAATTDLDDSQIAIAYSVNAKNTWKGEVAGYETEWEQTQNWTAGNIPLSTDDVLIPGGLDYYPSLTASSSAVANSIEIEIGASITANSYNITVSGFGGAWLNQGTFYPGTGTVTFNHGVSAEIVTIAGTTNLYNISVGANTSIAPVSGSILRIEGAATPTPTSKADWSAINSTVEWNGVDQNILNPTGFSGNSGYYNLILSGSGIKTMPGTALSVLGDFTLSGTATATAASAISVGGILKINTGATFETGAFDHTVGGNFDNSGTFTSSSGQIITMSGSSAQSILGTTATTFEKLTINNSAGVNIYTDVTVNNTLTLTIGNLNVGATTLTINGDAAKTSGFINVTTLSSLSFGGTTTLSPASSLFYTVPVINNLTINRTGGIVCCGNITVNGVLNLQSANPSSIIGTLDMSTYTLTMGENATTTGIGDVTGIVKREHIFNINTEYTFGSQYTTFNFTDGNLKPTWISLKISIGAVPSWSPWSPSPNGKVKRLYQVASSGNSSTSLATINMRYLVSELDATYNEESKLVFWHTFIYYLSGAPHEHGKAYQDFTNHVIGVTGLPLGSVTTTDLDDSQVGLAYSLNPKNTWKGTVTGYETQWEQAQNWTAGHVPLSTEEVLIPGSLTYYPSLTASANAVAKTLEIESGASITANSYTITVSGAGGAWINEGTLYPGTGTVLFNHGVSAEIVTVAGITNFYNISVAANTTIAPGPGCTFRIAGAASATPTSKADWSAVNSTVEWNGANQNVLNPQGIGGNSGYYNLILSGSGTKTMHSSAMTIHGDFSTSGTASATAADSLYLNGNITIGSGSAFATGSNIHLLSGNFENNGTFTPTTGGNVNFVGTTAQTISGSSTSNFDSLCINNTFGVSMAADVNVNNVLGFCGGFLSVGSNTLGINGTIYNPAGYIQVSSVSSLSFGGTSAITLNNNLFSGNPTINNLTINRSGGVTLGNESMTVNGTATLTSGTFTVAANTLTIAGNSPTRTSGNIDVSNASAKIEFTNTSAITLPASVFSGNVNNMTMSGAGGVTSGSDITMNGILNLQSGNPSSTKGILDMSTDTLFMGAAATTTGMGDVIGIVKRQHTFEDCIEYSFGNKFTTLCFYGVSGSTKPTWVSCRIDIGTVPVWRSVAVKRFYSFAQADGNDRVVTKLHYLDSELNAGETDESKLVFWGAYPGPAYANSSPRGRMEYNETDNWLTLEGMAIDMIGASTLDFKQLGLSYTDVTEITWAGTAGATYSGDWSMPGNWTGGIPTAGDGVLIPNPLPDGNHGYPYRNLLPTMLPAAAKIIEIEPGASITSDGYDITVSGYGDAWVNDGTFIPGTGTVIFNHGNEAEVANLKGTTNFYDLYVDDKTQIKAASNCITRIANTITAHSGSTLDFTDNTNTVEYNGSGAQTVINPTTETTSGYHNLIVSGGGTKTLPASLLNILGDFTSNATISATGDTLVMNGTTAQSISGSVAPALNDFQNTNTTATVTASVNVNCSGKYTNTGVLDMTAFDLGVTGTVTNSGTTKTASTSSTPLPTGKTWSGTVQYYTTTGGQTVMAGTYNNLTLSNTSGTQSASGNLTVNATLITTSGGLLDMGTNQLLGTLSTITNGGIIQTQNTSTTPIPTGKTWGGTVQFNATTGGQTIMAGTYSTLTLSNTSGTQTSSGAIAATTLNTSSGGTFNMVTYALSGLTTISNLGTLRTQNTSTTPFTSALSWGGTVTFDGSAAQTLPTAASTFNNLTISNTTGVTAAANQTVNGILHLSVANPDATTGSLDMSTDTLFFGANSNTTGVGDVTGIMTRTSFVENTTYTYGNPNQSVFFPVVSGQALPDTFSIRVTLLSTAPTWVTDATKRLYEISQSGGANTEATFRANYLDSELASGVDESVLSYWQFVYPFDDPDDVSERGWSDYNLVDNWISFSNANFGVLPGDLGLFKITIAPTQVDYRTWNGSQSTTAWSTATNWTPQGVPSSSLGIVIPDVSNSNNYSPDIPIGASGKYIIIQDDGILNAATGATLTLSGNGNVWSMESGGDFNPGNSVITFDGNISVGVVEVSGSTDFYDLTISSNTTFRPGNDSYIGIDGTLTNNGILDAALQHNTIEFMKDGTFTIPNANGATTGYHTLIISGTGTKTLPTPLNIWHNFTNNGTVAAGTGTVTFDGSHSDQIIGGSSTTGFNNLIIANTTWEVSTGANITVGGTLTINASATMSPGAAYTIGGTGTLTGSGTAKVTRITTTPDMATQYPITTKTLTNLSVDYCGSDDQTVSAESYHNLVISPNGTRNITLVSTGTIGVSGVFNPDLTTTSYTITGSTLTANGTGSQTIPAFNYYNVNVVGDRSGGTITLVNGGTIGIAGHSTVSATNATFVITNNTIDINGSAAQTIDPFSFNNVIFSNSGTKTTTGNLVVYGGFTVNSGTTLNMATYTLSGTMSSVSNNGTIKTSNTSAAPITTGKTWGGTIEYTGSAAQTIVEGTYNNLTMSGAGGGTLDDDITIDGVLSLSTNPSTTKGVLETATDTLFMGALSTTTGVGDVTGIIKRQHTFENEIEYTFGNQFTSFYFLGISGNIKPTCVACRVVIGTAPSWRSTAVKRHYSFTQSGGNDRVITKMHYLDAELDGTEPDESKLIFWAAFPNPNYENTIPRGSSEYNDTDNWVTLEGMAINMMASGDLDYRQWGLSYTNVSQIEWTGKGSSPYVGDWSLPGNWIGGVPSSEDDILIPATLPTGSNGYPTRNLLPVLSPAEVKTLEIESGAEINANDFDITVSGDTDAWVNNGSFIAGSGTVIFDNGSTSNTVTLAGTTNFNNLTVSDNTKVQPATSSILGIAGTLTSGSGSILDFNANDNTVEYNGSASQTVVNPGASYGYHNLNFSGTGTKTLPSSSLNISGDLSINADISTSGNTLNMNGTSSQTIDASIATSINNLTIDNANGVTHDADELLTISGILLINSGKIFEVAAGSALDVPGTLTNNAGVSGFILQSDASGTASLIQKTDNVPATMQRYISGSAEAWHFLSAPVTGQEISGTWLPSGSYGNGTGYDLYLWNEPTSCWIYKLNTTSTVNWTTVHPGANFSVGRGYLYSVEDLNPTKSFTGNLVNGDIDIGLTIDGTDPVLEGFNLVGNPYPSSIDWMASSGWTFTNLVETGGGYDMWIWNPTANNYGVYNSADADGIGTNSVGRYIAPMQGFFVLAASTGDLGVSNAVRVHDGAGDWFKNKSIQENDISLSVISDAGFGSDEIVLRFGYPANEHGALKLFSHVKTAPGLFMTSGGEDLSVGYFTSPEEKLQVSVNFTAGKEGDFTLSFDFDYESFDFVWLEDRKENFFADVKQVSEYSFSAKTTDRSDRFVLHFEIARIQENKELPANIWFNGHELILDLTLVNDPTDIRIVDMLGRTVLNKNLTGGATHHLSLNTRNQILIVNARTKKAFVNRKIYIN